MHVDDNNNFKAPRHVLALPNFLYKYAFHGPTPVKNHMQLYLNAIY